MGKQATIVERFIIPHPAFANAIEQIEQAFQYAQGKGEAEGLVVIGESGTGKTSVLNAIRLKQTRRDPEGMKVPILCATVPSVPTIKSLAGVLLAAMQDPEPDRGTANELTRRLRAHIRSAGTRMIMIDEFQHFYDRDKHKIMYQVADWLKVLIDDSKTTLVVAGLPTCTSVIDQNEQLARRFQERLELPRFCWTDIAQREQFLGILRCYEEEIAKEYRIPSFSSESMAFRFYCATGGLIGYLAKLLKQLLRNTDSQRKKIIVLEDIAVAHAQSAWRSDRLSSLPAPFSRTIELTETAELLTDVARIGTTPVEPASASHIRSQHRRKQSVNSRLRVA